MKTLLTLTLMVLVAGSAFAQLDNSMGILFSADTFTDDFTNVETATYVPFDAYVVLLNASVYSVGGYEVGIEITDPAIIVTGVAGPNGWTNFGAPLNHLAGYGTPVLANEAVVLSTITMLQPAVAAADIMMGPSTPSSVADAGPAISDGSNPDDLLVCTYPGAENYENLVATLNGAGIEFDGVVATEAHSLSSVKALFN